MEKLERWDGQLEDIKMEYSVEEASNAVKVPQSEQARGSSLHTFDEPDRADCIVAAGCGVLTGLLDSFWVGEFSLLKANEWGSEKINSFVMTVARKRGCTKSGLEDAIRFLEKEAPMASDKATPIWGGALQHHFRDFAHHASVIGLAFSVLTQFTGLTFGTDPQGNFAIHELPDKTLIGSNFEEKIYNGTVLWFLHLVSDMDGSSSTAGKGTGIPGPILSMAKELSVLPGVKNIRISMSGSQKGLPEVLSKLFNGTAFMGEDKKPLRFDLRTELGVYAFSARQSIPVVMNQCIVRAFFFVRRLCWEISDRKIRSFSDLTHINPAHFLPRNNRCILRMITISSGTFCAVDASDAAIRAFISAPTDRGAVAAAILLRINFTGIGNFVLSLRNDIRYTFAQHNAEPSNVIAEQSAGSGTALDDVSIDIAAYITNTGIYDYAFYRMYSSVKNTKEKFSAALEAGESMEHSLLQLEDSETRLYDTIVRASNHSLMYETCQLLIRLFIFYGEEIIRFPEDSYIPSYYLPFCRIENGKKIGYVLGSSLMETIEWEKIRDTCGVDGIRVIALTERGEDEETLKKIMDYTISRTGGFVQYSTIQNLLSELSPNEYDLYRSYVEKFNADVRKLIGYRTIVTPSDESLLKLKKETEAELLEADFKGVLEKDGIFSGQADIIRAGFWDREMYKALFGTSSFAESFISSEWYYRSHAASTALEQTAVIAGYLKSVEQLLYTLVHLSIDSGKNIRKKGGGRFEYILYASSSEDDADLSMGAMIGYIRHYSDLWNVNNYVKNYIADRLDEYRDRCRNEHFHKDNIHSVEEIKDIRRQTVLCHYLLLGAMKISDSDRNRLGITEPSASSEEVRGLQYEDLEQWLDRILGGNLLPSDTNAYFHVCVWGPEKWRVEFSTVNGFETNGAPQNMKWPYITDDLLWNRIEKKDCSVEEERSAAESAFIEQLKRYLSEGKYAGILKMYRTVSAGWFGNHTELWNREKA